MGATRHSLPIHSLLIPPQNSLSLPALRASGSVLDGALRSYAVSLNGTGNSVIRNKVGINSAGAYLVVGVNDLAPTVAASAVTNPFSNIQ